MGGVARAVGGKRKGERRKIITRSTFFVLHSHTGGLSCTLFLIPIIVCKYCKSVVAFFSYLFLIKEKAKKE